MGETEEFNTLAFEKRLMQLKDTQESIQGLSSWCLKQRTHHKKIVSSWLNVLKRVKVEQRLVLFYLANDVIQYSKRKNYEFVESWGLNLQKATPLVRDEKVRPKILRIFKIWEQRSVYDDEFLSDLTGLLSAGAIKKTDDESIEFQPTQLVNKVKQCAVLEADTDLRLKDIHDSHLELSDADALRTSLKGLYEERNNKDDVEKELNDGIACVERYTQALQREIVAREALLALLTSANQYYSTQRGEVKVVAYAYKNFGARVRVLKRKLDELIPTLPHAAPSPPQRDEDVPSPGPDEDLDLPAPADRTDDDDIAYNIDQTFNTSLAADGSLYNLGLTSFLTSDNPMALFNESTEILNSANKIEVINSRPNDKQDFTINDVIKNLITNDNNANVPDNNSVTNASISQKTQDTLPGLDLLTPDTPGNPPPPTSFYGTMEINDDPEPVYHPEPTSPWSSSWNAPRLPLAGAAFAEPPESPPPAPPVPPPEHYPRQIAAVDVDHRGILPPPPPPPALPLIPQLEDVDQRLLPALAPPVAPIRHPTIHQDVDHRNLIPLTHQQQTPRPIIPINSMDQDYRVPPMVPPSDIVESVDMDLSEDEDTQAMYQSAQLNQSERRHSFNNNNKVLVGGDNGKVHNDMNHTNLIQINSEKKESRSAPIIPPMVNPFDAMPPSLKNFNLPFQHTFDLTEENSNDSAYEEDLRNRGLDKVPVEVRNPSPPFEDFTSDNWQPPQPRPFINPRFPRNWGPRTNFRPPAFSPQQSWPRNGPRPTNRWMGPRPRFW
ncbi:formin-like protein 13 isoform X2 [Trichoplusia ni]|uniref:Regulation of nuclear pre-mRNA domain-containing protein 2 n=1 Tax=Trichoplusia ni TaxID=7111 RepID=A0A7E5WZI2_TRINI|nr:formin-like protein 13 isoform X2 [Trichoplusia ni]